MITDSVSRQLFRLVLKEVREMRRKSKADSKSDVPVCYIDGKPCERFGKEFVGTLLLGACYVGDVATGKAIFECPRLKKNRRR